MTVMFAIPAYGRFDTTRVCLRYMRWACDFLADHGVHASAVVVADDDNLDTARDLGFGTVTRGNTPLGRKWNDGYQAACDPDHNPHPADYVVPLGSDDWVDPHWVLAQLEADGELRCSRRSAIVSEDGRRLALLDIRYSGWVDFGDGVRMIPARMLEPLGYRPCDEDRERALDTSVMRNLMHTLGRPPAVSFAETHPFQIVDWKTSGEQLNGYQDCLKFQTGGELDPWVALAPYYPVGALNEMRKLYRPVMAAA